MAHSVFNIPELTRLIIRELVSFQLPPLLTISRTFFLCAVPHVWGRISGPGKLRRLVFPNVKPKEIHSAWVDDIQPLDDQSLDRFNLYAPYVKDVVDIYGPQDLSWIILLRAVSARPLLPSLRTFTFSDEMQLNETSQVIDALYALLCPTLVSIRAPGLERGDGFSHSVLSPRLMARLAESCPNISHLELYTRPLHNRQRGTYIPGTPSSPSLLPSLGLLHSLRTLGAGPEVLSPDALTMLGGLPSLESLMVYIPDDTPQQMIPDHFPPLSNSFLTLRHFGLDDKAPSRASRLWETLPFARRLISVYLKVDLNLDTDEDRMRNLVCSVCRFSPNVTDLDLDFSPEDLLADTLELLSPTVIAHLGRLPLKRLRILTSGAQLLPFCEDDQLALALTNVEYLEIQDCDFTYQGVESLAKHMPNLRFLAISLNAGEGWPFKEELPLAPASSPSVLCLQAPFTADLWYESNGDVNDNNYVDLISTALHRLWPNGVHCEFTQIPGDNAKRSDKDALKRINEAIKQLCSPNELHVPSMCSASSTQWQYSNEDKTSWLRRHRH